MEAANSMSSAMIDEALYSTASLLIIAAGKPLEIKQVQSGNALLIGRPTRDNHPDIAIESRICGRKHAQLTCVDGQWIYTDLGSINGSYVNGIFYKTEAGMAPAQVTLNSGDVIRIDTVDLEHPDVDNGVWILFTIDQKRGGWFKKELIQTEEVTIGRVSDNVISLKSAFITRHHAKVNWNGTGYVLQDLGSRAGTWYNGNKLEGPVMLKNRDTFGICDRTFVYINGSLYFSNYENVVAQPDASGNVSDLAAIPGIFESTGTVAITGRHSAFLKKDEGVSDSNTEMCPQQFGHSAAPAQNVSMPAAPSQNASIPAAVQQPVNPQQAPVYQAQQAQAQPAYAGQPVNPQRAQMGQAQQIPGQMPQAPAQQNPGQLMYGRQSLNPNTAQMNSAQQVLGHPGQPVAGYAQQIPGQMPQVPGQAPYAGQPVNPQQAQMRQAPVTPGQPMYAAQQPQMPVQHRNYLIQADIQSKKVKNDHGPGEIELLKNIRINIEEGSLVALLGTAGAGKTTLLDILNASHTEGVTGRVTLDGQDLIANAKRLKDTMGMVSQHTVFYPSFTVFEQIYQSAQLSLDDYTKKERTDAVNALIERFGMTPKKKSLIANCSGGEQRRVHIMMTMISDRRMFFLDEPDAGLDPGNKKNMFSILQSMAHDKENPKTIVVIIHDVSELDMFDQIIMLRKFNNVGRLSFTGSPAAAKEYYGINGYQEMYQKINNDVDGSKYLMGGI